MSARDWHADPESLRDDLAAYSLGALDEAEGTELRAHVEGCDECRRRLRWLRPAVDLIPASVPQLGPPPAMRVRLLGIVRAETEPAAVATAPERRSPLAGLRGLVVRPVFALGAVAVLGVGVAAGYLARGDEDAGESRLVSARALAAQPGEVSVKLERSGNAATLHVGELPALGRDEVYEVWVQHGDEMVPGGTFVLGIDGTAEAPVTGTLEGASAVFVTAEPEPGSERPTTRPVLEAPLQ